ncbi:MAG: T9SS type A sorting domain-containing protein [Bacteroidetes bacterium]|nr:T9SS type A sorting domain-containing protein [Bacteroidota bacterium]
MLGGLVMAQAPQRSCSTMDVDARLRAEDPMYEINRAAIEEFTQNYIATEANTGERAVVTIPVVVHIIYNVAAENIADARVFEQIDVLNKDFRRLNADVGETPAYFTGVAADCEINFCLATVDPSGNPTTGITRTSTTKTSFSTADDMKFATYGHTAWDRNKYLNLWVCDLSGGLLGYAQFPGGAAATDGVAIDYVYFGTGGGAAAAPYDLGRTATHEVGHWLNLFHIWGDDGTGCGGSDAVGDTPNQADETYGCPNGTIRISCSNGPNGDMYQNYMDYTDDGCMNLFTAGQKARAQALFAAGGARVSLTTSNGCAGGGGVTCAVPTGMTTTSIGTTTATFNWTAAAGATSYNVRYKATAAATWTTTTSATTSKAVTGLTAGTAYEWQVQTVCAAGATSAYTSSTTFTTTGGGATCVDNYEPNNTSGTAVTLSTGTTYQELIASSTDVDWFKFTTTGANTKIKVNVTSLPADYDVKLYNQSVAQKGVSENGGTADEQIIWNTTATGTRYVQVYGWSGAFNASDCYDLLISVRSANWKDDGTFATVDEEWNNSILGVFPNPASGEMVTVDYFSVQEDMNVTITLVDILGRQVGTSTAAVTSGENMIDVNINQLEAGFYFVVISNGKSSYSEKFVVE